MQQQGRHISAKIAGQYLDWAKFMLELKRDYATFGAAEKRQQVPGHSECAKHKLN